MPELNEVEQHFRYEIGMVEADRIESSGHSQSFPASSNLTTRKLPMNRGSVFLQGRVQPLSYMDMWFLQTGEVIARHIHGFYALIKQFPPAQGAGRCLALEIRQRDCPAGAAGRLPIRADLSNHDLHRSSVFRGGVTSGGKANCSRAFHFSSSGKAISS